MSPDFQVSHSQLVMEEFRRVLDIARERGILPLTLRASRWILEELARTPMEFGESREYRPHLISICGSVSPAQSTSSSV